MAAYHCECCDKRLNTDCNPPNEDGWCTECSTNRCTKCKGDDLEERVVDEVGGQAVGPYSIYECVDCGNEFVVH